MHSRFAGFFRGSSALRLRSGTPGMRFKLLRKGLKMEPSLETVTVLDATLWENLRTGRGWESVMTVQGKCDEKTAQKFGLGPPRYTAEDD